MSNSILILDLKSQEEVDLQFKNRQLWAKKCILSTAGMGKFSSDRTICEYAEKIWNLKVFLVMLAFLVSHKIFRNVQLNKIN